MYKSVVSILRKKEGATSRKIPTNGGENLMMEHNENKQRYQNNFSVLTNKKKEQRGGKQ